MTVQRTPERMAEGIQRARQRWKRELIQEARKMAPLPKSRRPFTIAISREAGTGAEEVARRLGEHLDWLVYDRELLEQIARETHLRTELLSSIDERSSARVAEIVKTLKPGERPAARQYVTQLVETVSSLAAKGECVIIGRGAAACLPIESTLAVRLVAPRPDRTEAVQARRGRSHAEAERWIEETDRQRREFVREHFHHDAADPTSYDVVLNVSRLTQEQCVDVIVLALKRLEA
jgi:cytidylate kinase